MTHRGQRGGNPVPPPEHYIHRPAGIHQGAIEWGPADSRPRQDGPSRLKAVGRLAWGGEFAHRAGGVYASGFPPKRSEAHRGRHGLPPQITWAKGIAWRGGVRKVYVTGVGRAQEGGELMSRRVVHFVFVPRVRSPPPECFVSPSGLFFYFIPL